MIQKKFKDPINSTCFTVQLLTKEERAKILKDGEAPFDARWKYDCNTFQFLATTPKVIAHECYHALETVLFIDRGYSINLEGHNEHIAYYLGWLVQNVTRCLQEIENKKNDA